MSLITRSDKGSPLTWNDMDQNLTYLESLVWKTVLDETHLTNTNNRTYYMSVSSIGKYRICPYLNIISMVGSPPPQDSGPLLQLYVRYNDEAGNVVTYTYGDYSSAGRHIFSPIEILVGVGSIEANFYVGDGTYNYNSSFTIQKSNWSLS